jgi:hypothetical protein
MEKTLYFCDRCKKEMPDRFFLNNGLKYCRGWLHEKSYTFNFCKDCTDALLKFLEAK